MSGWAAVREGTVWLQLLVLGTIQKLVGILSLGGVALASGSVGHFLHRWPALVGLGIRLLASGSSAAPRK